MNFATILNTAKDVGYKVSFQLGKYSPEIALGVGILSFGATIYEASKAGSKLDEITLKAENKMLTVKKVASENEEYALSDAKKDKAAIIFATGRELISVYGKTIVLAGVSIASFLCSYRILSARNAALVTAYAALDEGFRKYRSKITEKIGAEEEKNIYYGFEEKTITKTVKGEDGKKKKVKEKVLERDMGWSVSPYAAFFDRESIYFQREDIADETGVVIGVRGLDNENRRLVEMIERWANDELPHRYMKHKDRPGMLYLSEVYHKLGIDDDNQAARICGWGYDPDRPDLFANGVHIDIIDVDPMGGMLLDFNVDGPVAMNLPKYTDDGFADDE